MRIQGITLLLPALAALLFALPALADAPSTFTLEAQVFDPGDPYGFSYDGPVRVDLFDDPISGDSLWTETHMGVVVESGFLSLPLGTVNTVTPLADTLVANAGTPLYFEITLGGLGHTFPARVPVTSVPYALVCSEAGNAETFQNMTPDAFAYSGHDHGDIYYTEIEVDDFLSGKADAGASYTKAESNAAYLAISGKAADAELLDGEDSAYFAAQGGLDTTDANLGALSTDLSTNFYTKTQLDEGSLDGRYLGIGGKADDADKLDGNDSDHFGTSAALNSLSVMLNNAIARIETLETTVATQQTEIEQLENPDCPLGYERSMEGGDANYIVCKNGWDEIVKVGDFWIDRYETVIVDATKYDGGSCDGSSGTFYGRAEHDAHNAGFFRNGMDDPPNALTSADFVPMYACSLVDEDPSRWITWFQAERACNLAGKHLCTNAEWQGAAYGTPDVSTSCNTNTSGPQTGAARPACISDYGVVNMVGNVWEWTSNWWGQGADSTNDHQPDDGEFHGDGWWNVDNAQYNGTYTEDDPVFPASALRGGYWGYGSQAGVFALYLNYGPAHWYHSFGARCCRRK